MPNPLIDLLAPERCLACGARSPFPWCVACHRAADALRIVGACTRCAAPVVAGHGCWPAAAPIRSTTAAFRYGDVVADAVVTAKIRGSWGAWPALGALLAGAWVPREPDLVAWVPTSPRRWRDRGFDHAEALARGVARGHGLDVGRCLVAREHPDQGSRPARERATSMHRAFRAAVDLSGLAIALVDDVLTTGATATAAATALRVAGARSVDLVVLARAGEHDLGQRVRRTPATGPPPVLP